MTKEKITLDEALNRGMKFKAKKPGEPRTYLSKDPKYRKKVDDLRKCSYGK